jgi:uncharacterized protein
MGGMKLLKKHKVEFNTLTVVSASNVKHAIEVYDFLRESGSGYIQFIPLVERLPSPVEEGVGYDHAEPPEPGQSGSPVTGWSVPRDAYGDFLITIFDQWVKRDVGKVFVQMFDVSLGIWSGHGPGLCLFLKDCGEGLALEHNGDLYSCDHFVEPAYRLGNIAETSMIELIASPPQQKFGQDKFDALPRYCRECDVRFACHGGCPKDRFICTPDGEPGLNYLCAGYKLFFHHVDPPMRFMADALRRDRAPAEIMQVYAARDAAFRQALAAAGRNDPCPCGSGKKYKHCHGKLS